jgi:hypothetical protein
MSTNMDTPESSDAIALRPFERQPLQQGSISRRFLPRFVLSLLHHVKAIISTDMDASERSSTLPVWPSSREPCPEGSVPLHQLCDNCRWFFDTWEAFDCLIYPGPELQPNDYKLYDLCTTEYLVQSKKNCHFCMMASSSFQNPIPLDDKLMVKLHLTPDIYTHNSDITIEVYEFRYYGFLSLGSYCSKLDLLRHHTFAGH